MPSPLHKQLLVAHKTMARIAGVTISYRRGDVAVDITGVIGKTAAEIATTESMQLDGRSFDWLLRTQDISALGDPQVGDQIWHTEDGTTWKYEVAAQGPVPAWNYRDAGRQLLAVHTILTGSEEAA